MKNVIMTHSLSAGGTIRQIVKNLWPDCQTRVITSYDDYSHGPLPTSGTINDFFFERQAFWNTLYLSDLNVDHEINLRDEYASLIKDIQAAENVEIWIADSVQDIFYAAVVLHLLDLDEVDTTDIYVRVFGGEAVKWGLGTARVEEIEFLFKSSATEPLDAKLYNCVWNLISQSSSEAISNFIADQDPSTPLTRALSAYLLRFPEFNGGLGSIERALLGAGTVEMKKCGYTVGGAMALGEPSNDHFGDLLLFKRLVELSEVSPDPWFKLEGSTQHMRSSSAQITYSGKKARIKYSVQLL